MYPEADPSGKSRVIMYPAPGLVEYSDVGLGPIRGVGFHNEELVVVANNEVYTVATGGTTTKIGTLDTTIGNVGVANFDLANDQETVIADGTKLYHWDGTTFSEPTMPTYGSPTVTAAPSTVVWVDGFFIMDDVNSPGRFWVSNSYNGETWSSLAFATAERKPDLLKQIIVNHRDIYFVGTKTTEVWYNAGIPIGIPFRPKPGQLIEKGTIAPWSVANLDRNVIMLGQDDRGAGQVVAMQGNNVQVISTRAIEADISSYSKITDAVAYTYYDRGHSFYVLTFPTANKTWVYDFVEGAWHERASSTLGGTPGIYGRHRGAYGVWFDNKNIVGDTVTGKLYYYDQDTYTDNGEYIPRLRTTQYIHNDNNDTLFHRKLVLEVQSGVGDNTTLDPQIMMRYSDDGGHTWSTEQWRSLGKKGEYGHDVVWRNLKSSSSRVYEFKVTDPVNFVIVSGYLDVEVSDQL